MESLETLVLDHFDLSFDLPLILLRDQFEGDLAL